MSRAQNDVPPDDSSKTLYEQRKQRSIERFGPRCQVAENGLPKYCDDTKTLNRGITAKIDTEIAWQFFELNKDVLEIIEPQIELKLETADSLQYPGNLDTVWAWQILEKMYRNNPQIYGNGNPRDKYGINDLFKMGFAKKINVGNSLLFYQYHKGYLVATSEIILSIDTLGVIGGLNYCFFPEARDIYFNNFINEEEARKIAVEDTTIDKMIKDDPQFQDWMEWVTKIMPDQVKHFGKHICFPFEKIISCGFGGCTIYYRTSICVNQDAYAISIDGKTGKVTFHGFEL